MLVLFLQDGDSSMNTAQGIQCNRLQMKSFQFVLVPLSIKKSLTHSDIQAECLMLCKSNAIYCK